MKRFYSSKVSVLVPTIMLLLFATQGFGQGIVNDGAKISLTPGTYMTIVSGGFENQTNGTNHGLVKNDQSFIIVDGTWENNATTGGVFGAAPNINTGGTVRLNGAAAQNIQGSEETNFFHLQAIGGGDKVLNGVDVNVFGILTMTSTDVDLNAQNLTLENGSAGALSYFNGGIIAETKVVADGALSKVEWKIDYTALSEQSFKIPFKTAGGTSIPFTYNIADIGTPTLPGGYDKYHRFSTYPTDDVNTYTGPGVPSPGTGSWSDLPPGVSHLTADDFIANHESVLDRFWYIENNVQDYYTALNIPQIDYTFTFDPANDVAGNSGIVHTNATSRLVAQRFNTDGQGNGTWLDWLYGGTATPNNGSPTANSLTINLGLNTINPGTSLLDYYPAWTLVDNSDPLPIELVRFVGECTGERIEVSWTTWTETNNDFFTLERSNNGVDFEIVDIIAGAGNSNQPITYSIVDHTPYGGTSYYRLKDTDYDGKESYSDVIAVTCGIGNNDFEFVNAYEINNTELMLEFTAKDNEDFTVLLYDASGRLIMNHNGSAIEGMNKVRLDVADLARGIYIINLSNGKRIYNKRVMLN